MRTLPRVAALRLHELLDGDEMARREGMRALQLYASAREAVLSAGGRIRRPEDGYTPPAGMSDREFVQKGETLKFVTPITKEALARGDTSVIADEVDELLAVAGIKLDHGSASFRKLALAILKTDVEAYTVIADRQEGEPVDPRRPHPGQRGSFGSCSKSGGHKRLGPLGTLRPGAEASTEDAIAAFTLTSALCGLAPGPLTLVAARLLQGASAPRLSPQVFSLVRLSFAEGRERTPAFAVTGVALGLGNVCGQIVGGILLQADLLSLARRPVFLVNVPIGVVSLIVTPFVLPKTGTLTGRRLDAPGVLLCTVGLGMLMYPLIEGRSAGWPIRSLAMLAASPVVLPAFFLHQRWKTRHNLQPLLDTNLPTDCAFALGALVILIDHATMTPLSFSFTLLEQMGFGRSPMTSALDLAWLGGPAAVSPLFTGRLIRSIGIRRVLIAGAAFDLAGLLIGLATGALKHDFFPNDLIPSLQLQGIATGCS